MDISFVTNFPAFLDIVPHASDHTCIYYLSKAHRRCKQSNIAKRDIDAAALVRDELIQASSWEDKTDQLKLFARLCCCKQAHRSKLDDYNLLDPLIEWWQKERTQSTKSRPRDKAATLSGTVNTPISSQPLPQTTAVQSPPRHGYCLRSRGRESTSFTPNNVLCSDSALPRFRPRLTSPSATIAKKLQKRLSTREGNLGILYLFSREKSPGFVKIGYTTTTIRKRLSGWAGQCGYDPILQASFENIPHVIRVESLVHYELTRYWRTEIGCQCGSNHVEWFEMEAEAAIEVAQQWCQWMTTADPYHSDGWLKTFWRDQIRDLEANNIPITARALLKIHAEQRKQPSRGSESCQNCFNSSTTIHSPRVDRNAGMATRDKLRDEDHNTQDFEASTPERQAESARTSVRALVEVLLNLSKQQQDGLITELVRRTSLKGSSSTDRPQASRDTRLLLRRATNTSISVEA